MSNVLWNQHVSSGPEWKILKALNIIERFGGIDGSHHKQWVIDQVVRILLDDKYDQWVIEMTATDDDVPDTYEWDVGVAP